MSTDTVRVLVTDYFYSTEREDSVDAFWRLAGDGEETYDCGLDHDGGQCDTGGFYKITREQYERWKAAEDAIGQVRAEMRNLRAGL